MTVNQTKELASKFHKLFAGAENAHGTCELSGGRISSSTVRSPVTEDLWSEHLSGMRNLGVCPIDDQGLCSWGVIDLDSPGGEVDLVALALQIERAQLPLIAGRSKSGGAHLYLFPRPTPATAVHEQLRYCSKRLGHPHAEVFPKQAHVNASRGDVGSWILMPYFNAHYTKRYAVDSTGRKLSAQQFLELASSMREAV